MKGAIFDRNNKMTIDARRHRAHSFTAMILQEISDLLPNDVDMSEVSHRVFKMMYENGFAWTNDEERAAMGLEPRDHLGWTPSENQERLRLEQELALKMLKPIYYPSNIDRIIK